VHVLRQRRGALLSNCGRAAARAWAKFDMTKITFCVSRGNLHTSENTRENAQS
jgi:hypothetical protein